MSNFVETEFLNKEELVDNQIKIRILNSISAKCKDLSSRTVDKDLLSRISSISSIIEDAYHISMYKFQLSIFTKALNKEISLINGAINI